MATQIHHPTSSEITVIAKRTDFLSIQHQGVKQIAPDVVLQAGYRADEKHHDNSAIRVGFTASRKIGNAVHRNRAKRRLRAWVRLYLQELGMNGADYVFIARRGILSEPWSEVEQNLKKAVLGVNRKLTQKHKMAGHDG